MPSSYLFKTFFFSDCFFLIAASALSAVSLMRKKKNPRAATKHQNIYHLTTLPCRGISSVHELNVTPRTKKTPGLHIKLRQDRPYPRDCQLSLYYLCAGKGHGWIFNYKFQRTVLISTFGKVNNFPF